MRKGVTFIEVLLVVMIVAVISIMGPVFYSRFMTQNNVDNTADKLVQTLRKAQLYAMEARKSETLGWGVTYTGGYIVMYLGNTYAGRTATWDERLKVEGNITLSAFETNFVRVTGVPDAAETITITWKGTTKTISVNAQGMIGKI